MPEAEAGTRRCPYCAEEIQQQAIKCKHCGEDLTVAPAAKTKKRPVSPVRAGLSAVLLLLVVWAGYRVLARQPAVGENTGLANAVGASNTHLYRMVVNATETWATFDLAVNRDDIVTIKNAVGSWRIKRSCPLVGWQGHPEGTCPTLLFDGRIVKTANRGALLWRPEGMVDRVFVAEVGSTPVRVEAAGRLQFQINDDSLGDNDGKLTLEIAVTEVQH